MSERNSGVKGRFITIEGGEGVGKTTLQRHLVETLLARGIEVVSTREPGGVLVSEKIRALILDPENKMGAWTETLLFLAARAEHLLQVIYPALAAGKWVVCDRFNDSTVAYQGYGRGQDVDRLMEFCNWMAGVTPDLTLWIDLDPEEGLRRTHQMAKGRDRIEEAELDFHRRVHAGFRALAECDALRIVRLGGELLENPLFEAAWSIVEERFL